MIGSQIGQYRVLRVLGKGGMGQVFLVEHAVIGSRHALKMLHADLSSNDVIVRRFLNEARAASSIGHRNVVEISHVDQLPNTGAWYVVMKYFEGQTLAGLLRSEGALRDQRRILHIAAETLNGLQAAHDHGIIHRDLKPDNLFLTTAKGDPNRVVLLDFGVAQLDRNAGVVTQTGTTIGTPVYMSAEQLRGQPIDPRADLYAIGAILYEMITGRLPYEQQPAERTKLTPAELIVRMKSDPVPDPRLANPAITEGFARAVLAALALDAQDRPASARDLALRLAEATPADARGPSGLAILQRHADELLQPVVSTQAPTLDDHEPVPPTVSDAIDDGAKTTLGDSRGQIADVPRAPYSPLRLLAIGLAVLTVFAAATWLVLRPTPPPAATAAPPPDSPPVRHAALPVGAPLPIDAAPEPALDAAVPTTAAPLAPQPAPPPRPVGTGRLSIAILPWAEVWVDGKPYGQTPSDLTLPAGRHRVRLKNDTQDKTVTIIVTAGKTAQIDESW